MLIGELPELLTIKQAAHLLNVHPGTLHRWEREGKILPMRIGSRRDRRFTRASLMGLIYNPEGRQASAF